MPDGSDQELLIRPLITPLDIGKVAVAWVPRVWP
jgi:hypothetical protein